MAVDHVSENQQYRCSFVQKQAPIKKPGTKEIGKFLGVLLLVKGSIMV